MLSLVSSFQIYIAFINYVQSFRSNFMFLVLKHETFKHAVIEVVD